MRTAAKHAVSTNWTISDRKSRSPKITIQNLAMETIFPMPARSFTVAYTEEI